MIISNFINENGNPIKIKIKNKKDTGRNYKTNEKFTFTAVSILIQGPTSESENIVTRQEAEEMYECLRKFLNK
jgi:hypothetical protein